ncbi:MAG: hypothetical protein A2X86_10460 [Bdellovibrionales bacterium GWA2_49_15]|nr:MAG: hypothetical protein A2X86_10460 [Bdellovibrionales bacterium GWA2_49_15]
MRNQNWACVVLLTLTILVSCGETRPQKRVGVGTSLGSIMDAPKPLSGQKMDIAYTMCLALRNKTTEFRSKHLNEIFSFEIEHTACNRSSTSTVITTRLHETNNVLIYDSTLATFYFKNVETHTTGLLAPICGPLLKGQLATDTVDEGDGKRQFNFYAEDGRAKVTSYLARRDTNAQSSTFGQFIVVREDIKQIETGPVLPGVILGLESDQTQRIPCPDGVTFESVRQLFLTHSPD